MIVSFDLDDTLFVSPKEYRTEAELSFPTSFRSEVYIRGLFKHYGVKLDEVINGERHLKEVQGNKKEAMPSKYPSKYRIDLHIDDDHSVLKNGKYYGFRVHLIGMQDDEWTQKILDEIRRL